jgi:tRNA(fMet)-specific endonuclease VapC
MHVLDTDIASLLYYGKNSKVLERYHAFPTDQKLILSPITRAQLITGRCESLLKAATGDELLIAEKRLNDTLGWVDTFEVVRVEHEAAKLFDELKLNKKLRKIGLADLLTACICLAEDATLVTRNVKDFELVPNLKIENWAA